jgi:hypothetical protein
VLTSLDIPGGLAGFGHTGRLECEILGKFQVADVFEIFRAVSAGWNLIGNLATLAYVVKLQKKCSFSFDLLTFFVLVMLLIDRARRLHQACVEHVE